MKKTALKTLIFIGYFLGIFFLKKIAFFSFSFLWLKSLFFQLVFWLAGAILGAHLVKLDQLFYVYFVKPQEPLSLQVKLLVSQKKIADAWDLLEQGISQQTKLGSRSFLFQTAWIFLALFALTSTASIFGKALVMGIGLKLLLEEWEDMLNRQNIAWLFWQIKREVPLKEQKWFLWLATGVFGVLSFLLI